MSSVVEERLRWSIRAYLLLRRTTRPRSLYPASILTGGEITFMRNCFDAGWTAKQFCRVLVNRDKLARA